MYAYVRAQDTLLAARPQSILYLLCSFSTPAHWTRPEGYTHNAMAEGHTHTNARELFVEDELTDSSQYMAHLRRTFFYLSLELLQCDH